MAPPKHLLTQPDQAPKASSGNTHHVPSNGAEAPAKEKEAFITADLAAAYEHFLPEAKAIAPDKVRTVNVDPDLALHNTEIGVKFFADVQHKVVDAMPRAPVARFLELTSLARAVLFAADQVIDKASDGEIKRRLAECGKLRSPMLRQLEVLADPMVKLADADVVKDIRKGSGSIDKAHDAVNIAAYFRKNAADIAGKHPFTEGQIAELAEHGHWLLGQLERDNAIPTKTGADPNALLRDQMWTLLWTRYDQLRGAVAACQGFSGLDEHVPPLGARVAATPKGTNGAKDEPAAEKTSGQTGTDKAAEPAADQGAKPAKNK